MVLLQISESFLIMASTKYSRWFSLETIWNALCLTGKSFSAKKYMYKKLMNIIGKPTHAKSKILSDFSPAAITIPLTIRLVEVPMSVAVPPIMAE